jgi:hypothetical protein
VTAVAFDGGRASTPVAVRLVVTLTAAAAAIHLWVVPEHLAHWWAAGVFFIAVAAGQALFSAALPRRSTPGIVIAGILANLGVVALWAASRTWALPLGPAHDHASGGHTLQAASVPEPVGLLDVTATALELATVVALVSLLPGGARSRTVHALCAVGIAIWALHFTVLT